MANIDAICDINFDINFTLWNCQVATKNKNKQRKHGAQAGPEDYVLANYRGFIVVRMIKHAFIWKIKFLLASISLQKMSQKR